MSGQAADVAGKVVLVTGGAQGIGGGAAKLCAERGAKVIITDVQREKGDALAQSLRDAGHEAAFMQLDVSDAQAVEDVFKNVGEKKEVPVLILHRTRPVRLCGYL